MIEKVDTILEATGYKSEHVFEAILNELEILYHVLGDANAPIKIKQVISDAYTICKKTIKERG